jgi:drug/metabolite transporter superfamily protein YnfA
VTGRSIALFAVAAIAEIGGAYLMWQAIKDHRGVLFALAGAVAPVGYGVIAALQPSHQFGGVLAPYGGVFIVGSLLPDPGAVEIAAGRAKALGDPTRSSLASALAATDELCVCDLAWISGRPENLVAHHVRALRAAGLAESRRHGKMVLYSLSPSGRQLVAATPA